MLALTCLCSCGDDASDYPSLVPTDRLLAEPTIPGHAAIAARSPRQVVADLTAAGQSLGISAAELTAADPADAALAGRADAVSRRSATLGEAVPDRDDLAARAAALRARAAALAQSDP